MSITHDIHLKDVDASTSVNYASLMHAKSLDVSLESLYVLKDLYD